MFDKDYTNYWEQTVKKSIDGCKVADDTILDKFLKKIVVDSSQTILDLGCSYGRMYEILNTYTKKVYGIDVDMEAINRASKFNYISLHKAYSENTLYPQNYFDNIIAWGLFDVVDQEKSLIECNRILKDKGKLLFTGKNINYHYIDEKAFTAERNAKLKLFPHKFTNVDLLLSEIHKFGFKLIDCYTAELRGDMGENKFKKYTSGCNNIFYEYVLILEKTTNINEIPNVIFTEEFSLVAKKISIENNFDNIVDFFQYHKDMEEK